MVSLFGYDRRKIGIDSTEEKLKFLATSPRDIDLALYYLETHSSPDRRSIAVERVDSLDSHKSIDQFVPWQGSTWSGGVAYYSHNYVLLNSRTKHAFADIALRYHKFFQGLRDQRKKTVKFLDFDYEILSRIAELPFFRESEKVDGFSCQFNNGEIGEGVQSIMFYVSDFTPGLKKLFGYNSKHRIETLLEERILL